MYTYARDVSIFLSHTLFLPYFFFPRFFFFSFLSTEYVYVRVYRDVCMCVCIHAHVCAFSGMQHILSISIPLYIGVYYYCVPSLYQLECSLFVSLTSTVFLSLSSIQRVCGTGSVCSRAQICACRLVGDREFWMDLERSEICQGDGMGRYRFRKGGTSRKTLMEKCISSITTQEKQRGSILETGTPFSMYMFVCTRTRAKTASIYEIACDLYARTLFHLKIAFDFFLFLSVNLWTRMNETFCTYLW